MIEKLRADEIQEIRDLLEKPIIVITNSAFRTSAVNKLIGGSDSSQHLMGQAVDFESRG